MSDRDCQYWLTSAVEGSHNNNDVDALDKHVSDLMASTRDIKTPRASIIAKHDGSNISPEDLVERLNSKRRQSTSGETKAALVSIIEFISGKKEDNNNAKNIGKGVKLDPSDSDLMNGCFTDVSYAGSFAYTPRPEEEVRDCFMDCLHEEQFATETK